MKEKITTPEEVLIKGTLVAVGSLAVAEILGLPRNPMVDLTAAIAILNVAGVPATPMLEAIKSTWKNLKNK